MSARKELAALRSALRRLEAMLQATPGYGVALTASGTGDWTVYPADAEEIAPCLRQHHHCDTLADVLREVAAPAEEIAAVEAALRGHS